MPYIVKQHGQGNVVLRTMPMQMDARQNFGSCAQAASNALSLHLCSTPPCLQQKGNALLCRLTGGAGFTCLSAGTRAITEITGCKTTLFTKSNKRTRADLQHLHADLWQTGCCGSQPPLPPVR